MIAYLDSSVLLRLILNQEGKLKEFATLQRPIASRLLKAECLRSLDRLRVQNLLAEIEYLQATEDLYEALDSVELITISESILDRCGSNFAVPLGTPDAIHLCSALYWQEQTKVKPVFLTHDEILGRAARMSGFEVLGTK
jgi:predicted nucleic acid-binding protein